MPHFKSRAEYEAQADADAPTETETALIAACRAADPGKLSDTRVL